MDRCFICNRKLGKTPVLADTRDDQLVYIGRECAKLVIAAGDAGFPTDKLNRPGHVRVYPLDEGRFGNTPAYRRWYNVTPGICT